MGIFINELKKRGAYLYGSRALGVATSESDYDWALLMTKENREFLMKHGFWLDDRAKKYGFYEYGRPSTRITDMPGLSHEKMESFRKGNTNVILMSDMLFNANKFATNSLKAIGGKLVKTKHGRVSGYQTFGMQFAALNKID